MNEVRYTPAIRRALRLWYRAWCGERRLEKWLECGQYPPNYDNGDAQRLHGAAWLERASLSDAERSTLNEACANLARRMGWR